MHITVIAVGKLKEKYWKSALEEYVKRLSRYCRLDIIEVADEKAPETLSPSQEREVRDREGERILRNIRENDTCIALAIEGKSFSSEEFARHLDRLASQGRSNIVFIIGGSLGLSEEVLKRADMQLSFSAFTFPHQLMRIILLEQIYRAFRIINGEPYHK